MTETNFDRQMRNMTASELTLLIITNYLYKPCTRCIHRLDPYCDHHCYDGVYEWMMKKADKD